MEACLRSFRVMVLVAPLYAIYLLLSTTANVTISRRRDGDRPRRGAALRRRLAAVPGDLLRDRAPPRLARSLSALHRRAQLDQPAGDGRAAIVELAISTVAPAAVAIILELGLQALFFYWFLMTTRMTLGAELGDRGRAAGRELGAVALPVTPRRLATSASPCRRRLGRSAPPSGRARAAAPSARRACGRARPALPRRRAVLHWPRPTSCSVPTRMRTWLCRNERAPTSMRISSPLRVTVEQVERLDRRLAPGRRPSGSC